MMSEINPKFSFPSLPTAGFVGGPQPSVVVGSPPVKSRRHAHRRSAAVSEDLSASDLAQILIPAQNSSRSPSLHGSTPHTPLLSASKDGLFPPSVPMAPRTPLNHTPATKRFAGEPGEIVSTPVRPVSVGAKQQKKKRRSFVSLFRKGGDGHSRVDSTNGGLSPPNSIEEVKTSSQLLRTGSVSPNSTDRQYSPPPNDFSEETLIAPSFYNSPLSTPRNSGEAQRESICEPEPPSIDLDEALCANFGHRNQDNGLESPFSKAPSLMNAVLEEEGEEEGESELPSPGFSRPISATSSAQSWKRPRSPISPRPPSILNNGPRGSSIVYVGSVTPKGQQLPPSPVEPTSGTKPVLRVSIAVPEPAANPAISGYQKHQSASQRPATSLLDVSDRTPRPSPQANPAQRPARTHVRRRSLIDKLLRRD